MIKHSDVPLVSLGSMNETHFEEINIINMFLEQLDNNVSFEILSDIFEELLKHMKEHFSGEETLMQEMHYPSFHLHKGDHDKVLNQARYAELQWRNKKDRDALREYLEGDVASWLDQHIKAMDTPMSEFILHN